ncbi:g306 [Coccomyxa elongata]
MLNQPRDANGCFSRRQPARRSSMAGTEDSWSLGSMADPKTTLGQGVKMLKGGGGIFKSAAVAVLRLERKLMTTGDITKPQEGLFGLREWEDEGFVPDPVPGIPPPSEIIERHPRSDGPRMVRRVHRFVPGRSPEEGEEEYSDLGESASRGASEDITDSPTPLLRPQNLHPLGVRYDPGRAGALQLLGDVCMTPLPLDRDFLEAAGSTEAKPAHLAAERRRPQPLSTDGEAGIASTLSSPLRLDKLAAFHDMVTSPEGRARLAAAAAAASPSPDSGPAAVRKRPRLLLLDMPTLDSVDLDKVGSLSWASPATVALFAGFLPSAQVLPAPLYLSPPHVSALSPLPFATLHRPESAQRPPSSAPSVLSTPNMISLAFAEAELFPAGDMQPPGQSPSRDGRCAVPLPTDLAASRAAPDFHFHHHYHQQQAQPAAASSACMPPFSPLTALLHSAAAAPGPAAAAAAAQLREGALRRDRPPPPLLLPLGQEAGSREGTGTVLQSSAEDRAAAGGQDMCCEWFPPGQGQHPGAIERPHSPTGGSSTPTTERLRRIEAKVQQMEANLGANHPQACTPPTHTSISAHDRCRFIVGKAWLYLSKAYQNFGSKSNQAEYKEKSEAALFRRVSPIHPYVLADHATRTHSHHLLSFQCMRACSSLCTAFFDAYPAAAPALAAAPAGDGDFAYLLNNVRSAAPQSCAGQPPPQAVQQPLSRKRS